jgi:processive 1,2-diacylglycerol beta-glucosyltransferase
MNSAGEKVLILSTKAGAGHLRAAAAIEEVFKETHPEVETRNVEALEYTNPAFQASFTSAYDKLASDLPSVWGIIYQQMDKKTSGKSKKFAATG